MKLFIFFSGLMCMRNSVVSKSYNFSAFKLTEKNSLNTLSNSIDLSHNTFNFTDSETLQNITNTDDILIVNDKPKQANETYDNYNPHYLDSVMLDESPFVTHNNFLCTKKKGLFFCVIGTISLVIVVTIFIEIYSGS